MRDAEVEMKLRVYAAELGRALEDLPFASVVELIHLIARARERGNTVFLLGNGGSASTASHFACDLGKGTIRDGSRRVRVVALSDNVPLITAWANDSSFEEVFAEQLENMVESEDVVIGISTSGNSKNVLVAIGLANQKGAHTVALVGQLGGKLADLAELCIRVPSTVTQQIEDAHLAIQHMISLALPLHRDSEAAK